MQPVAAAEIAVRAQLAVTLQQEIAISLDNIFQQAKQAREVVENSPAHQKYVVDQLKAKRRLELCENALSQREKIAKEMLQEFKKLLVIMQVRFTIYRCS